LCDKYAVIPIEDLATRMDSADMSKPGVLLSTTVGNHTDNLYLTSSSKLLAMRGKNYDDISIKLYIKLSLLKTFIQKTNLATACFGIYTPFVREFLIQHHMLLRRYFKGLTM